MFYVYEWFIKETGEVIYVGKGTGKRYKAKKKNKMLNEFLSRFECDVRIVKHFEVEADAFEFERERIDELKAIGQCVCNIYRGGLGGYQSIWTEEKRKRMSENNPMKLKEQKDRMSKNNPMKNKEVAKAVAEQAKRAVIINGVEYPGTVDAAESLGVWTNTVLKWLRQAHDADGNPCRYADEEQMPYTFVKKVTSSRAVLIDGKRFESLKEAADYIGVTNSAIYHAIKDGRLCKGHKCEYDNQQPS